ncbi:hypothetical protein SAY87_009987 [Trapa incisa]|uniref:Transmembrane protein n=2 Tax=Trapa TaxID=22665 RepID=A0AAN7M186_TRANT|nr:hypothetical protein SAY87_009987 [Trapa incisa]KAK4795419.1 hypothetical protein SAY86_013413 [Trapa natans]
MSKHPLLVFCLFFFITIFISAVPSSGRLDSVVHAQRNWMEMILEDGAMEGRMDLEQNDYPDPGSNPGHDPNVPGAA